MNFQPESFAIKNGWAEKRKCNKSNNDKNVY